MRRTDDDADEFIKLAEVDEAEEARRRVGRVRAEIYMLLSRVTPQAGIVLLERALADLRRQIARG